MSKIHIRRAHHLGLADARTRVSTIAEDLKKDLDADYQWHGDQLRFERSGASGTIDVGDDFVEIDVKLGLLVALMKGTIEDSINRRLDDAIGPLEATRKA